MDDESLDRCFKEIARKYGYDEAEAVFVDFRDLKVSWNRTCRRISFKVSDYLVDAPEDVMNDLAETIMENINGGNAGYPVSLKKWMSRPAFAERNQPVYLERCGKHTYPPEEGKAKDLYESVRRLKDAGLIGDVPGMKILWMNDYAFRIRSYSSVLMKTVMIAGELDSADVPDYVVDWFVYKEVCQVTAGIDLRGSRRVRKMGTLESLYPRKDEAEQWIAEKDRKEDEEFFGSRRSGVMTERLCDRDPDGKERFLHPSVTRSKCIL